MFGRWGRDVDTPASRPRVTVPTMDLLVIADLLLALGFTLRLTRLLITDDIGDWYIQQPVKRWADPVAALNEEGRRLATEREDLIARGVDPSALATPVAPYGVTAEGGSWRSRLAAGVDCPWCLGFWVGALVLLSLYLAGGPGDTAEWWRWVAGAFTLNWVAAHVGPRLGDAG